MPIKAEFVMGHTAYYSDKYSGTAILEHAAIEPDIASAKPGAKGAIRGNSVTGATLLNALSTGILNGASALQFMAGIDAGSEQLGNRAFLRWVGELYTGVQDTDTHTVSGPLQFMPKKQTAELTVESEELPEASAEPGAQAEPEITLPQEDPKDTAPSGKRKKKKKSKVQVALNILRSGGMQAFKQYIDEEITATDSLRRIRERIGRALDLDDRKEAASRVVDERLRALDPETLPSTQGVVEHGQDRKEPVRAQSKRELSPKELELFDCCYTGNVGRIRRLLRFGVVDVNMARHGETLLCIAAYKGFAIIVRELLSMPGIYVNLAQKDGATPLFLAVQQGNLEVVKLLLAARGINVNLPRLNNGTTPLILTAQKGFEEISRLLLAVPGINIDAHKTDGTTALLCAVENNLPGLVEQLVRRGADVNQLFDNNASPLILALDNGSVEVAKRLLGAPAIRVNQATILGITPLIMASRIDHKEIIKLLLSKGADPNITDNAGISALHFACTYGNAAIVEMLLDAGAGMDLEMTINVTETGIKSQLLTALGIAQLIGHRGIIDLLTARQRSGTAQTTQVENLSPCLRPQGQALEDQPGLTSPLKTATQETPVLPSETPTLPPEKSNTTPSAAVIPATAKAEQPDTVASSASPDHSMQTLPDSPSAKTQSPLDAAKDELIQELLRKLGQDNLEPLEGIRLMMEVRATKSLDSLCGLYNRVAGIERQKERARRRKARDRVSRTGAAALAPDTAPTFALGEKPGLDAEAVEGEIKQYLDQTHHRFVSQAVNDMEFGRGKPTTGYPGLLHASAGIAGVGSCSVFFYTDEGTPVIRIVGVGHHVGRATYELAYAAEALGRCGRILRIA